MDTKVNLDAKVIAIVGPNEAGKTTLLRALTYVGAGDSVSLAQRSRAADVSDETPTTTFEYVLDASDIDALADLDLHVEPTRVTISRTASGSRLLVDIRPGPLKSVSALIDAVAVLSQGLADVDLDDRINPETVYNDPGGDNPRDFRDELGRLIDAVQSVISDPGVGISEEMLEIADSLLDVTLNETGAELRSALSTVSAWARRAEPGKQAVDRLWRRSPDFILFSEADRSIQSAYTFDAALANEPPAALANLAGTASLDLAGLYQLVISQDVARRRSAIVRANKRMDSIFRNAWKQSQLSVHFEIDGDQLRIELMEDDDSVTVFDERSAGLRMFVALVAFLQVHGSTRPPVLLVDEAENHLHIDAQADLVNMFAVQDRAAKVIYTTHSPACLPPDLGTGIRAVVPRAGSTQISDIKNSFWEGAAGYSPLMLAMGAAAAAFTPARSVVLAEGASEMILLPTLLRAVTGESEMPYQVAPGLSEIPTGLLPTLDLEAARVAYLVDADGGGERIRMALISCGVPETSICSLGMPGVENLLDAEAYRTAIVGILPECNPGVSPAELPVLPSDWPLATDASWSKWFEAWAEERGLKAPSKVAVASRLVEQGLAIVSPEGQRVLSDVHERLVQILGYGGQRRLPTAMAPAG